MYSKASLTDQLQTSTTPLSLSLSLYIYIYIFIYWLRYLGPKWSHHTIPLWIIFYFTKLITSLNAPFKVGPMVWFREVLMNVVSGSLTGIYIYIYISFSTDSLGLYSCICIYIFTTVNRGLYSCICIYIQLLVLDIIRAYVYISFQPLVLDYIRAYVYIYIYLFSTVNLGLYSCICIDHMHNLFAQCKYILDYIDRNIDIDIFIY